MKLEKSEFAEPLLHTRLTRKIENYILMDYYIQGGFLPSVSQLKETFGISKITIEHATRNLANLGILKVEPGRGTRITLNAKEIITELRRDQFFNRMVPEFLWTATMLDQPLEQIMEDIQNQIKEMKGELKEHQIHNREIFKDQERDERRFMARCEDFKREEPEAWNSKKFLYDRQKYHRLKQKYTPTRRKL